MLWTLMLFLLCGISVNDLEEADEENTLLRSLKFSSNRLEKDKYFTYAEVEYTESKPEEVICNFSISCALSFRTNSVRYERTIQDQIGVDYVHDVRRLRKPEFDCFQMRKFDSGFASSNFIDVSKKRPNPRENIRPPSIVDPYYFIANTISLENYSPDRCHESRVDELELPKIDNLVATFRDNKSQNIFSRFFFENAQTAIEVEFGENAGKMPVRFSVISGITADKLTSSKPLNTKVLLNSTRHIQWKEFPQDLWLPVEIDGSYVQRDFNSNQVVREHEYRVIFKTWKTGEEVPDELFTFEDLQKSEIGESVVNSLRKKIE